MRRELVSREGVGLLPHGGPGPLAHRWRPPALWPPQAVPEVQEGAVQEDTVALIGGLAELHVRLKRKNGVLCDARFPGNSHTPQPRGRGVREPLAVPLCSPCSASIGRGSSRWASAHPSGCSFPRTTSCPPGLCSSQVPWRGPPALPPPFYSHSRSLGHHAACGIVAD